jgi:FMN-dependent NADH-azoreductase
VTRARQDQTGDATGQMETILRVDADPHRSSELRRLADLFMDNRTDAYPDTRIVVRDLALTPPPHIADDGDIRALYARNENGDTPPHALDRLSRELIAEVEDADRIVVAAPMYNMTVPSILKSWIDLVVRARRTFRFTESGPVPLLPPGKCALLITAAGGVYRELPGSAQDFLVPYLRAIFAFIGIESVRHVGAEGLSLGVEIRDAALRQARQQLENMAKRW